MNTTNRTIFIIFGVIILTLAGYRLIAGAPETAKTDQERCAVEITSIVLEDKEHKLKEPADIARGVFNHYFSFYTQLPDCPEQGLNDYRLQSIGEVKKIDDRNFTADIVFDLKPLSMTKTKWISPEAAVDGDWIIGKKGVLSIRTYIATSTAATTTHYLVL